MALDINIRITAETDGVFSAHETSILQALAGTAVQHTATQSEAHTAKALNVDTSRLEAAATSAAEEAPEAEEAPAKPVRKRASRAKAKTEDAPKSTGPAVLEDDFSEPEAQDDTADEADLLGGDDEDAPAAPEYTIKDALAKATLVLRNAGGRGHVAGALAQTKATKVSALEGDDIATFIAVLDAAEG